MTLRAVIADLANFAGQRVKDSRRGVGEVISPRVFVVEPAVRQTSRMVPRAARLQIIGRPWTVQEARMHISRAVLHALSSGGDLQSRSVIEGEQVHTVGGNVYPMP